MLAVAVLLLTVIGLAGGAKADADAASRTTVAMATDFIGMVGEKRHGLEEVRVEV